MISYTKNSISKLNSTKTWNSCIINTSEIKNYNHTTKFTLYPTGEADLSGRKYVALPNTLKITPNIKTKYNLL